MQTSYEIYDYIKNHTLKIFIFKHPLQKNNHSHQQKTLLLPKCQM